MRNWFKSDANVDASLSVCAVNENALLCIPGIFTSVLSVISLLNVLPETDGVLPETDAVSSETDSVNKFETDDYNRDAADGKRGGGGGGNRDAADGNRDEGADGNRDADEEEDDKGEGLFRNEEPPTDGIFGVSTPLDFSSDSIFFVSIRFNARRLPS